MRRTPASTSELLALNGVLEPLPATEPAERSWIFRSVGAGHPVEFWRDLVDALGAAGYDGALSIEHEDPLLSHADGLELAVTTLRAALGRGGLSAMPPEHSEVVVGLDVGTTGVKGIAVAPDGTVAAVAEHGYPLSTPQPAGRSRIRRTGGARRRSCSARWERSSAARGSPASGSAARCTGSSRSTAPTA